MIVKLFRLDDVPHWIAKFLDGAEPHWRVNLTCVVLGTRETCEYASSIFVDGDVGEHQHPSGQFLFTFHFTGTRDGSEESVSDLLARLDAVNRMGDRLRDAIASAFPRAGWRFMAAHRHPADPELLVEVVVTVHRSRDVAAELREQLLKGR